MRSASQHKNVESPEKNQPVSPDVDPQSPFKRTKTISSVSHLLTRIYSPVALRILALYICLWAVSCALLSDTFLLWIGLSPAFLTKYIVYKRILFLGFTAPVLYFAVSRYHFLIQKRNQELEALRDKMQKLNVMHRMLSQINHSILRLTTREQLLNEICQIMQTQGGYAFVWIGLGETEALLPKIIANAGGGEQYLTDLFNGIHVASADERGEPGLSALRKKYLIIVNDVNGHSKKQFAWQKRALTCGYLSIGAFPLKTTSGLTGVIALYSATPCSFSDEHAQLLQDLAADVSYGLSDIEQKEQIYYAANFDVTTNLPNQQLFEDRLNQSIKRALHDKRYTAVAMIKITNLQKLTESYGQAAVDKLLLETGKHLTSMVRDGDTIARINQNEIGIMLTDVADVHDIAVVVHKIVKPFLVRVNNFNEIQVRFKAGISIYPKDSHSALTLIEQAQETLNQMSASDQNDCAFYSKEISNGVKYSKQIEVELQDAIEKEEFHLYYQPIVDLKTRMITGVEALVRWQNQKLGEVSPVQFISIAEQMGLMEKLGEWILTTACKQLVQWKSNGIDNVTLSVNLTAKQLMNEHFLEKIKKVFNSIAFNPREYLLGLEISEDTLLYESKILVDTLFALREMGLKIYIDDFGTGYASLNYLHQLPIDAMKIDSLFIRTLEKDHNTKELIKGILAFSSGLGVKTIAEGVETEKQLKTLQELGCSSVQGYFFSPPAIPTSIEKLFNKIL